MVAGPTLVTGATGFVGANLVRCLLQKGRSVRVLVRPDSDRRNLPPNPRLEVFRGDLRDKTSVTHAVRGCREIFHAAADYRFWARDPQEIYESNFLGTRHLLLAALESGIEKFVHTSTVGTIGLKDQPKPANEESDYDPGQFTSHYKKSKMKAEEAVLEAAAKGLNAVVVNPSTPIGAWDRKPTPTGKIIVDFVNGRMPAYVETGLNFIHVKDVALGHVLAAEKGRAGERYILGHRNMTMLEFLDLVARETGLRPPKLRMPYALALIAGRVSTFYSDYVSHREPAVAFEAVRMTKRFMFFDSEKALKELGLPQTPVEIAVRDAVTWFADNGYFNDFQLKGMKNGCACKTSDSRGQLHLEAKNQGQ